MNMKYSLGRELPRVVHRIVVLDILTPDRFKLLKNGEFFSINY